MTWMMFGGAAHRSPAAMLMAHKPRHWMYLYAGYVIRDGSGTARWNTGFTEVV